MEEHQRTGARYRYHAAQLMKPAIKIFDGDTDTGCPHALVQDLLGDGQFGSEYDVEQRLNFAELLPVEESLTEPEVQTVQRSWNLSHLAQDNRLLSYAVENFLQVQEATVALYVQLVKHLGGVARDMLPESNVQRCRETIIRLE